MNNKDTKPTGHTPGPWIHATNHPSYDETFLGNKVWSSDGPGHGCIAQTSYDRQKDKANARLIAAAPELLEACRKAYEAIGKSTDGQLLATYNDLKLTINKATKG